MSGMTYSLQARSRLQQAPSSSKTSSRRRSLLESSTDVGWAKFRRLPDVLPFAGKSVLARVNGKGHLRFYNNSVGRQQNQAHDEGRPGPAVQKAVVAYSLDRISRKSIFSALIEVSGRLGIDFVSIQETLDISILMGGTMMYIASVFSQLE